MKKVLIVVDMQNDFVTGSLGTPEAQAIVPRVKKKIEEYMDSRYYVVFTRDTHYGDYMNTLEGKYLPVEHCIRNTNGWEIIPQLKDLEDNYRSNWVWKRTFGYDGWYKYINPDDFNDNDFQFELVGLCTDICVISNALILRAQFPNSEIIVHADCCAGTTPEKHKAALEVMKSCQIIVEEK